jgi:hypothetical protein
MVVQIPAWPFVALSFGVGVFALGPFFALWTPSRGVQAPPEQELQGWTKLGLKGTESSVGAWLILAGALITVGQARTLLCSVAALPSQAQSWVCSLSARWAAQTYQE